VRDNGKPLRVAYVGGTAIPFTGTAEYYDRYIASAKKMGDAAADYGATVLLSNHTEFDNAYYKAPRRKPRDGRTESFRCRRGRRRGLFHGGSGLRFRRQASGRRSMIQAGGEHYEKTLAGVISDRRVLFRERATKRR
jgi:hypothetical protein